MPSQTFTASTTTSAPVARVWERLQVPATWEAISGVDSVFEPRHDDSGQLVGFKFSSVAAGRQYVGTATPAARIEEQALAWNITTSQIRGQVRIDLDEEDGRTRLDVTMRVESVSMITALGFPIIASAIGSGFPETVEEFAANLSSPEPSR